MSKPSQADRVLLHLMRAGTKGVCQSDWLQFGGADGQGRITRLAARVNDLREIGMDIRVQGSRDGFVVYRLYPRVVAAAPEPSGEPQAPALFELAAGEQAPAARNAILDEEAA